MIAMPVVDRTTPEGTTAQVEGQPRPNGRRDVLRKMLKDLEEEVVGRLRVLRSFPAESEPVKDPEEEAVLDVSRDLEVWLVERGFETLKRIDEALARLDEGLYGICGRCRSPIADERLQALPFAALCQECQRRDEEKSPSPAPRL